jgi:hypothetical protein
MSGVFGGLVAAFTVITLLAMILCFVLLMRYFKYKERQAIAEANGRPTQKEPTDE